MRPTILRPFLAALAACFSLLLMSVTAVAAQADEPPRFSSSDYVYDGANVLGSQAQSLNGQLGDGQPHLYVVTTRGFSDPSDPSAWVQKTANNNGLSSRAAILAISVGPQGNKYRLAYGKDLQNRLTAAQRRDISDTFASSIRGKDIDADSLASAIAATDDALRSSYQGQSGQEPGATGHSGHGSGVGKYFVGAIVIVLLVVVFFVLRSALLKRKRAAIAAGNRGALENPYASQDGAGKEAPQDPLDELSVPELRKRADSLLIATDDAIKSSEQELGFAQAQYGDNSVATFAQDIANAKGSLTRSFQLQQQLDDDQPDTEAQQRDWLKQIIRNCESADASLKEHKSDFDQLREMERNAPQALATLQENADALEQRFSESTEKLQRLADSYAPSALNNVHDNVAQAQERLTFAQQAAQLAQRKIGESATSDAVLAIRAGEEAIHQGTILVDAISKADSDLANARTALETSVSQAAQDLAQANALVRSGANPELAAGTAGVQESLQQIKTALASGKIDPYALSDQLHASMQTLETPLNAIRDQQEQRQRAQSSVQQWIMSAQSQISGTEDFIRARRGGVGATARTRLAEAQRNLDEALSLSSSDPVRALTYAQQADSLARSAAEIAQSDVDNFSSRAGNYGGGYAGPFGGVFGGGGRGSGMGGALLGGILLGQILGNHNSGGGFFGGGGYGGYDNSGGGFGGGFGGDFGGGDFGGGDGGNF